jgi:hypothetical protein
MLVLFLGRCSCGGIPNNNQLFLFLFISLYVISYKDNDLYFIPSIDIYSKVNITMAIYKRRHFSAK